MVNCINKMEKDSLIIITGASGGLGSKITEILSKKNKVLAIYNKNKPKISSKNIKLIKLDLTKNINLKKKLYHNKKIIFLNLASIKIDKLMINLTLSEWKNSYQINVHSFFNLLKKLLPEMIKVGWGKIIIFSSTDGYIGDIGTSGYTSTKHSLHGINKIVSKEYGSRGITSNILLLGNYNYGLYKKLNIKKQKKLLEKVPSKKTGNINNIINAIEFLIKSNYVNGSEIKIDGGI